MKQIVSISGGMGSFFAAKRVADQFGVENTVLVFMDTKTEDEDLYRFLDDCIKYLNCELITLADGRDIWQVFHDRKYMGNNRVDLCSRILKRELFRKWLKENYQPDQCQLHIGLTWTEEHRFKVFESSLHPYKTSAPLLERPFMDKRDFVVELERLGIEIPRLYKMGFEHNNCGGFCVKTGQAQFKQLWNKMPERYLHHEQKQEELFNYLGKTNGFIRVVKNNKQYYLTMKEFREQYLNSDEEIDNYDIGGCGCFF